MSCLMIPIRSNCMNGCLIRKLILFLCLSGRRRKEKRLVFDGGYFYLYDFCNLHYVYSGREKILFLKHANGHRYLLLFEPENVLVFQRRGIT